MKKFVKDTLAGLEDAIAYARGDKSRGVLTEFTVPDKAKPSKRKSAKKLTDPISSKSRLRKKHKNHNGMFTVDGKVIKLASKKM